MFNYVFLHFLMPEIKNIIRTFCLEWRQLLRLLHLLNVSDAGLISMVSEVINARQRGWRWFQNPDQNRHDGASVPPRSCPWYRQHLHFHRRSQTFSWMWQNALMTKPVLCSRAGFLMHWKRQREEQRETGTPRYTNADTRSAGADITSWTWPS